MIYRKALSLGLGNSSAVPVQSDPHLPAEVDAVVIGGGVTGAMTALCLQERGVKVAICEKGVIGGEASSRSMGMIGSLFVNPVISPLMFRAKTLWPDIDARIERTTGFVQSGTMFVLQSEEEEEVAKSWIESVKGESQLDPVILPNDDKIHINTQIKSRGILYQASDGQAEPTLLASALVEGARRLGATIHQQCAVRGVEQSTGVISAVVTEHGSIKTKIAILAGGAWSPLFLGNLNLDLPQLYAFSSNQSVKPPRAGPSVPGLCGNTLWRREADGGYAISCLSGLAPVTLDALRYGHKFLKAIRNMPEIKIGIGGETLRSFSVARHWNNHEMTPFEHIRVLDPKPNTPVLESAITDFQKIHVFPDELVPRARWAGALTSTPDNLPVVSEVSSVPGLLLGTGIYFGLTLCPAVGELLADLATGATPKVDPYPFRYQRLVDGSSLSFHH